jgi:glucose-1-phosphate thymidylyltransferase
MIKTARKYEKQIRGAKIMLKEVPDPQRCDVTVCGAGKIMKIEAKPQNPRFHYAGTGNDVSDSAVFEMIRPPAPSTK